MALTSEELAAMFVQVNGGSRMLRAEHRRENVVAARIEFPRGFIRTVAELRPTLPAHGTEVQRRNAVTR